MEQQPSAEQRPDESLQSEAKPKAEQSSEIGGRQRLDPTRYGDWEKDGRCIDF